MFPIPEAEEFYLKGRYYWHRRTEGSLNLAVDAFTQAVVHDPAYAQAYAGSGRVLRHHARVHFHAPLGGLSPRHCRRR